MSNQKIGEWRHIVLYAKGWYGKNDMMEDLRKIISNIIGIPASYIDDNCIYENVAEVFNHCMPQHTKDLFLRQLFLSPMFTLSNEINIVVITKRMLSELYSLQVKDGDNIIFVIGEPDENILPLSGGQK